MSKFKNYSYYPVKPVLKKWFPIYLMPYICLDCQKAYKYEHTDEQKICPQCKGKLTMLSRKFKTPKQSDGKEWAKIKYLIEHGFRFYSDIPSKHGVHQRVKYPETMQQAYELVEKYKKDAWEC